MANEWRAMYSPELTTRKRSPLVDSLSRTYIVQSLCEEHASPRPLAYSSICTPAASSLKVDKVWKYYICMSVHTLTQSTSLSRMEEKWLSWKELKSSLSLPTHMLTCPFKRWGCWKGYFPGWNCRLRHGGLLATYTPESEEVATQTSQQGQEVTCISENNKALPNFSWHPPPGLISGSHFLTPPLCSHL